MTKKTIDTLIEDMYALFDGEHVFKEGADILFAHKFAKQVVDRIAPKVDYKPSLRMSNIGQPCEKKLWHDLNTPELAEPLTPQTKMKFVFGDMYEEFALFLAEQAGHTVEGLQSEMELDGLVGHRDAVIDGMLVDVKSASAFGFEKFANHELEKDDAFGYIPQLQAYLSASQDDPLVTVKDRAAFLVINKVTGALCLDVHEFKDFDWSKIIERKRGILEGGASPPRGFDDEPHQKSGNRKLGVNCSYCHHKHHCWPGLRTFLYGKYPVSLTVVNREPKVYEIKDN